MSGDTPPPASTSSADPLVLARYAADGTAMATTLQSGASALAAAAGRLASAGATIPGLDDLATAVGDLAADWCHLDAFAGAVAAGFLAALGPGFASGGSPSVVTLGDDVVAAAGTVGLADRDVAVAAAREVAGEYRRLLDAAAAGDPLVWDPPHVGGVTIEALERLARRTDAHQHDTAFAVTFAEVLGVEGVVGLRGLHRRWAQQARRVDRPRGRTWTDSSIDAWANAQMAGVAGVLSTAMATATTSAPAFGAGAGASGRAGRSPADRLDRRWVQRFEQYAGDAAADHSLLVREARLPADVVAAIGDHVLGDGLGGDGPAQAPGSGDGGMASGPSRAVPRAAAANVAAALAADADASVAWLSSDGIDAGTPNLELVLTHGTDVAVAARLADVVAAGLTHPTDTGGRTALLEQAVRVVADGGAIAEPAGGGPESDVRNAASAMHVALARGAAANMDVVDGLVNDGWDLPHFGQPPASGTYATHDFLREVMADRGAAHTIAGGYEAYTVERLRHLPPAGTDGTPDDGLTDRVDALRQLGTVEGVIVNAENNAVLGSVEERIARQRARAAWFDRGVHGAALAVGFHPIAGAGADLVDGLAELAGVTPGELVFPADVAAHTAAVADTRRNTVDANVNFAILLALADGAEPPPVASASDLDDANRQAFVDWVVAHYDADSHSHLTTGFHNTEATLAGRR